MFQAAKVVDRYALVAALSTLLFARSSPQYVATIILNTGVWAERNSLEIFRDRGFFDVTRVDGYEVNEGKGATRARGQSACLHAIAPQNPKGFVWPGLEWMENESGYRN